MKVAYPLFSEGGVTVKGNPSVFTLKTEKLGGRSVLGVVCFLDFVKSNGFAESSNGPILKGP